MFELAMGAVMFAGVAMFRAGMTPAEAAVWLAMRVMAAVTLLRWSAQAFAECFRTRWHEALTDAKRRALYL